MINTKYSYNGYDPASPATIAAKAELKRKLNAKEILYKQYSSGIIALKTGFKRVDLSDEPVEDFNDTEIIGTSFGQDEPFTECFPAGMTGVIFRNCNLDNCVVPKECTIIDGTCKQFKEQNDCEYWIVDDKKIPIVPRDEAAFDKCLLSKDPKDIPLVKVEESITTKFDPDKIKEDKIALILEDKVKLEAILKTAGEI